MRKIISILFAVSLVFGFMANANAAKVSIIILTQSIYTAVKIASVVIKAATNTQTTATTLIVS